MSFNTLRNAIKTKLDSIPELKFVDDKHHYAIPGYPAVTFEPSGIQSEEITASDNKRTYILSRNFAKPCPVATQSAKYQAF